MRQEEMKRAIGEINTKFGFTPKLKSGPSEVYESLEFVAQMGALHNSGLSKATMDLLKKIRNRK